MGADWGPARGPRSPISNVRIQTQITSALWLHAMAEAIGLDVSEHETSASAKKKLTRRGASLIAQQRARHALLQLRETDMLGIPRRYAHFVFGIIQSGLTSAIAAAIASCPFLADGSFMKHWLQSWLMAWLLMLPVVLFAAPAIRKLSLSLTRED